MRVTIADLLTASRIPLAIAFPMVHSTGWRLAILAVAGGTDMLDGVLARRFGSSRLGVFLDPVADKLFMVSAFGVVLYSGALAVYEVVGVLLRDIGAAIAFAVVTIRRNPASLPARAGGKAVTMCQTLTMVAFVLGSPLLRPLAWATAAVGLYAIWDYNRVADRTRRPLGG